MKANAMSDTIKKPSFERAKIEVFEHIMEEWRRVKNDRASREEFLARTGPGESPYTSAREQTWNLREEYLARSLLASMSDIAPLIQSAIDSTKGEPWL